MLPEIKDWLLSNGASLIGSVVTVIGFYIAARTVVYQLGRQHESSLELQRRNAGETLRIKVHEILVTRVRSATHEIGAAASYLLLLPMKLQMFEEQTAIGLKPAPIDLRLAKLNEVYFAMSKEKYLLLSEFESWAIVFPNIEIFQLAINSAHHDVQNAFTDLIPELVTVLPLEMADGSIHVPPKSRNLTAADISRLQIKIDKYHDALDDLGSYVFDLSIEAQNVLLAPIFGRKIKARQPLDPKHQVISTSKTTELTEYFTKETAWGRRWLQAGARAP